MITGKGKDAIQMARIDNGPDEPASYVVFMKEPYIHLKYLQYGTPTVSPRPWLTLAYEAASQQFRHII